MPKHNLPSACRSVHELAGMQKDTPVLLAFSGGADSTALLSCLLFMRKQAPFPLVLAHVNHGIRGEESERDRDFCRRIADQYGLEICILDTDVPALANASGKGIEETAREVRYAFFAQIMKERGIPILATAHHADDQIETVLFRMSRGSGTRGMCGIRPVRSFANGVLVRPMLEISRSQILDYCKENNIPYVTDSTNEDTTYMRNRIRHELIPVMESMFPNIRERISELCAAMQEDEDALQSEVSAFLRDRDLSSGFSKEELCALPNAVLRRMLVRWLSPVSGQMLESVHLNALVRLIRSDRPRARVALPGNVYVTCTKGRIDCTHERTKTVPDYRIPFAKGEIPVADTGILVSVESTKEPQKVHNLSTPPHINLTAVFDIMEKDAYWRPRQEGDVLFLGGMHRKLRRLYAAREIPLWLREQMPLLCDREGILWAPGVGIRDGAPCSGDGTYRVTILLPNSHLKSPF